MQLSDNQIKEALKSGSISFNPTPYASDIQPATVDIRLGQDFIKFRPPSGNELTTSVQIPGQHTLEGREIRLHHDDTILIHPGELLLAETEQVIGIDNTLAARVEGKSSLGRLGIMVHVTAGFVDPGWYGRLTFEVVNMSHITWGLTPGMKIAQISFFQLTSPSRRQYGDDGLKSHYHNANKVQASRYEDEL